MAERRFFYLYDHTGEHRRPVVTICRLCSDDGAYGYGWAICSDADNPCKRTGRTIAEGRALSALQHRRHAKGRLAGEGEAWTYRRAVYRPSAVSILKRCGLIPIYVIPRLSSLAIEYLIDALPKAMRPYFDILPAVNDGDSCRP